MKILAFTDLHENMEFFKELERKSKKADIVICAGDFTIFNHGCKKMVKTIASLKKPTYLIHGNHENMSQVEEECKLYDNIRFIHKKVFRVNGINIFGYGGGGFSYIDRDFENFIEKHKILLTKKNILVTHQPPYNTIVDEIVEDEHAGSKSIKKYLNHFNLAISGHLHETFNKQEVINKKTLVINPSPTGMLIEIN
ncbi:metallophosphoesterase family protein [Candidatus Woesearchaeota archaeon]|nr:metallophosphoesterase family protein [Candidatus Woesearchaeota archaeon]